MMLDKTTTSPTSQRWVGLGPRIVGAGLQVWMPGLTPLAAVAAGVGFRELGAVGGVAGVLVFVVLLAAVYGGEQP